MEDKRLSKLSRLELLEMLIEQSREVERLTLALEQANEQLRKKELVLSQAGSIAQASLQLNGVFEAAEKAAQQYLENVILLQKRQEEMLKNTKLNCEQMEEYTFKKCQQQIRNLKNK